MIHPHPDLTRPRATTLESASIRAEDAGFLELPPKTKISRQLAAVITYFAVSLMLWAHVWIGANPAHSITCNCGDTVQQVWWFEWLPWAVSHGHNPLLTNTMWARLGGVNVLSNTSWLAPAAVLSPITLLFGPVASFNVANLLAPVVSGWAAFALWRVGFRGERVSALSPALFTPSRPLCLETPFSAI